MTIAEIKAIAESVKRTVAVFQNDDLSHKEDTIRYFERGFRAGVLAMVRNLAVVCERANSRFDMAKFIAACDLTILPSGEIAVLAVKETK